MPQITQEQIDAAFAKVTGAGAGIDPSSGNFGSGLSSQPLGYGYGALGQIPGALAGIPGMFARGGTPPPPPDLDDEQGLSEFISNMAQEASALKLAEQPDSIVPGTDHGNAAMAELEALGDTTEINRRRGLREDSAALEQAAIEQELQGRREDVSKSMPGAQEVAPGQFYQGPEHLPVGDVGHVPYGTGGVSGEYDANIKRIPGRSATVRPGRGTLSMSQPAESIPQHPEEKLKYFQQKADLALVQAREAEADAQKRLAEKPWDDQVAIRAGLEGKPPPPAHPAEAIAAQIVAGLLQQDAGKQQISGEQALKILGPLINRNLDPSMFGFEPPEVPDVP